MAPRERDRATQRKPKQILFVAMVYMATASGISACAHTLEYDPDVIDVNEVQKHYPGKALLVMSVQDQAFVHFEDKVEYRGGFDMTTLTTPVGEYTKNLALKLLDEAFEGGVVLSTSITDASSYSIIFEPTIVQFKPVLKQVSNANIFTVFGGWSYSKAYVGAEITLRTRIIDSTGVLISEKDYQSGEVWERYMFRTEHNWTKVIQQTIFDLMAQALTDAEDVLPLLGLTPVLTSEISPSPGLDSP